MHNAGFEPPEGLIRDPFEIRDGLIAQGAFSLRQSRFCKPIDRSSAPAECPARDGQKWRDG